MSDFDDLRNDTDAIIAEVSATIDKLEATAMNYGEFTYDQNMFCNYFRIIQQEAHKGSVEKGFWDQERNAGEAIALMHSELTEALEGYRHDNPPDDKIPAYNAVESELADTIIRIMDWAEGRGLNVCEALCAKLQYNKTRAKMHGGKLF